MKLRTCFIILLILGACSSIHREQPDIVVPEKYKNIPSVKKTSRANLTAWWKDFGDPSLEQLISTAIKHNKDISLATERVLEARAAMGVAEAELFPSVSLQADITRQKQSFRFSSSGSRVSVMSNTFRLTPVASYEVDLWGRLSYSTEAARQRLLSSIQNRKTLVNTVISDLVSLFFERVGLERKLGIAYARLKNSERILNIIKNRYNRGLSTYIDLLQARAKVKEDESSIPQLTTQAKDVSYRISILTGRYPEDITPSLGIDYLSRLRPIEPGLPSELLMRRPDIRAGYHDVEALFNELHVARARRFPKITLTGSYGWVSDELRELFKPDSVVWQISSGIFTPLFDAGKLKASEQVAHHRYREGLINYAKTVLQAFYEVEKALMTEQGLFEQREKLLSTLKVQERAYQESLKRYRRGLVDLIRVLDTERGLYRVKELLVNVETGILKNRVFLYRALGGTWEER